MSELGSAPDSQLPPFDVTHKFRCPDHPRLGPPTAFWRYYDDTTELIGFAVRFDDPGGAKQVVPYTLNGLKWGWQAFPEPRPLFNLDQLAAKPHAPVIVTEGEKAAEAANRLLPVYVATTSPMGSEAAAKADWSPLKGRDVVIWPDADEPGAKYAEDVARLAKEAGATVRIIAPPGGVERGWDAADALSEGWSQERVAALVEAANDGRRLTALTLQDFLTCNLPPRENILGPWLPKAGLAMIYAKRGLGKTYIALGIAHAVAAGGKFLHWQAPKPRKVLYLDGEMVASTMQQRLREIDFGATTRLPDPSYLQIITPDLQSMGIPDLATQEGQDAVEEWLDGVELVIVDNLSTLCRFGKENEAESWLPVQDWALQLRRRGITVLFIHHAGKGGQQRGTSRREDVLDTVIALRPPPEYHADQGLCVECHFEKARTLTGSDVAPFEITYEVLDRRGNWMTKGLEDSRKQMVANLYKDGIHNQRQIAEEMRADGVEISASTINRIIKELKEVGII
ncbi:MAG: AAA family ATPase [Alphaproteobacteria bacterium]|nr:AAA family ATPase [Alphaproteobacteria bacterium]